jgi:hypothetical protein
MPHKPGGAENQFIGSLTGGTMKAFVAEERTSFGSESVDRETRFSPPGWKVYKLEPGHADVRCVQPDL